MKFFSHSSSLVLFLCLYSSSYTAATPAPSAPSYNDLESSCESSDYSFVNYSFRNSEDFRSLFLESPQLLQLFPNGPQDLENLNQLVASIDPSHSNLYEIMRKVCKKNLEVLPVSTRVGLLNLLRRYRAEFKEIECSSSRSTSDHHLEKELTLNLVRISLLSPCDNKSFWLQLTRSLGINRSFLRSYLTHYFPDCVIRNYIINYDDPAILRSRLLLLSSVSVTIILTTFLRPEILNPEHFYNFVFITFCTVYFTKSFITDQQLYYNFQI